MIMIHILLTKVVDNSVIVDNTRFSINSYDFLSVKYFILNKKPFLNNELIFTSYNGLKGFLLNFKLDFFNYLRKRIYVVGDKTFFYVKKYFPFSFLFKKYYVQDIIEYIIKIKTNQYYDWFCGNINNNDLSLLKKNNINRYKVYETILSPKKIDNLYNYDVIVFFSPSGVRSFFLENNIENDAKTEVFAIGKTTAKSISNFLSKKKIWYPSKPSLKKIFSLIKKIF
ncbi:uroporphyrinogen-III synthase [Blattabacterium cuenoti]|uniref:uroporphyrinogen-III synthase n=1 Tax=Blattabacterium cuenoti TaxID=1653831 RepID=UPI001EEC5219|nr:uroporphyrinogen-III synthase [Blattabacterium cuenoti]